MEQAHEYRERHGLAPGLAATHLLKRVTLLSPAHKRVWHEAGWVFAGQTVAALGALAGIRLVTEAVAPSVYGSVALLTGAVTLAFSLAASPLMQAVLRFYPGSANADKAASLRQAALQALCKPTIWALLVLLAGISAWSLRTGESLDVAVLCAVLLLVEIARSVELTFLNAARRQRVMSVLVMTDAWMRPLAAVAMVWLTGAHTSAVLLGYIIAAGVPLLFFVVTQDRPGVNAVGSSERDCVGTEQLKAYAMPLIPLPLVGWTTGQLDRYFVAALAGLQAAGIYAAIYGLASRPFLMIAAGIEVALRQVYYGKVDTGNRTAERQVFRAWLGTVFGISLLLLLVIALLHEELAALLLAEEYRAHSVLMIWIAAGYLLAACCQVVERVCYARHDTRGVLIIESTGAIFSVAIALPMVYAFGISGAAWAVPTYFGLQLAFAIWRAVSVQRREPSEATHREAQISNV